MSPPGGGDAMFENGLLFDVLALLLAAVVVVPLFQRIGVPSVLGYLAAGVALGPYTPGMVVDLERTRPLAEFGVVFLLFAIGLQLPLARLKSMRRHIFGLGLLQVVLTGTLLGAVSVAMGLSLPAALVVGATLAFSSTATVLALLVERGEALTHQGRISISILIFQDLAVVPVLALLPLLAGEGSHVLAALGMAGGKAAGAIVGIYLAGRFIVRPAYRFISKSRNAELFTAANLLVVLAVALLTAEAGMSMALGAFLAGLLLAGSPYRHQVEADIEPFRGLLLGLFFMTVGMSIDFPFIAANIGQILGVTGAVTIVKVALVFMLCRAFGQSWQTSVRIAFLLSQVGEFGFVVFTKAGSLGVLSPVAAQTLLASAILSMLLTPALALLGRTLGQEKRRAVDRSMLPPDQPGLERHVVIAGFGRVGQGIAHLLDEYGLPYVAVDLDIESVASARARGLPVYFGDAGQVALLRSIGIQRARAAVITVNTPAAAQATVSSIRSLAPALPIIARAHDLDHESALDAAGVSAVVPETMEASLQMARILLKGAGIDEEDIERSLQNRRAARYGIQPEPGDGTPS